MSDDEGLRRLAALAGIESHYWDIEGVRHDTSPATARRLLSALGLRADSAAELTSSLAEIEEREWRRLLPPVFVSRTDRPLSVPVRLPGGEPAGSIAWRIVLEDGHVLTGESAHRDLAVEARRSIGGRDIECLSLPLPNLPAGYHELRLETASGDAIMPLIAAPPRCYLPPALAEGRHCWGLATQLYSIKSVRNWGIGDFSDLRALAEWSAGLGADALGVNPLHALFPSSPESASPYSPNSRLFRNALYLDVAAIADDAECAEARRLTRSAAFADALAAARDAPLVDYTAVSRLKYEGLEVLYAAFRAKCIARPDDTYGAAFQRFQTDGGAQLRRFAVFLALSETFGGNDWTRWPTAYRDPASASVAAFSNDRAERVGFFQYLQWQADLQFAAVASRAKEAGMAIGLYGDVAVSIDPAGADHWSRQNIFAGEARIGAPPDPFSAQGQEWGVVPMNPLRLRDDAYTDFIALLRSNMRHVGALRIDHVMGLQHSYWVPAGAPASEGAYVAYPLDDLLGILALESHRNECLVVGEALGTVPDGFRPRMERENVLSYRVLYFEAEHDRQKRPDEYPRMAATCVATHDLATLKGFWHGTDLDARRRLGLHQSAEADLRARDERAHDKWLLLRALAEEGLLPPGLDTDRLGDIDMTPALALAVHAYLARSSACLFMVQLDDLIGEEHQINLPGTQSEYPNWRRRLSMSLEAMIADPVLRDMARTISRERAGAAAISSGSNPA
ncbi:4-alpha-glucanotransferase [Parvibaculum sp.]|uniref:4-alpha-glucanotransferase n=1 Tax=Parvibaculum sp. TaxID=2024848 RepID=UPI0038B36FC1